MTEYRDIPGYDGLYRVGDDGSVWSQRPANGRGCLWTGNWRRLNGSVGKSGYLSVVLIAVNGKRLARKVHQLVLESFVGPRPSPSHVTRHVHDNTPTNCNLSNLAWGTQTENNRDKRRHGTQNKGVTIHLAKLTDEIVAVCRQRSWGGETCKSLSKEFGVRLPTMLAAVRGYNWRHVSEPPNPNHDLRPKLGYAGACEVRRLLAQGIPGRAIAKKLGINESVVSTIKHNRSYT